jgi:hypothetical protein
MKAESTASLVSWFSGSDAGPNGSTASQLTVSRFSLLGTDACELLVS